MSKTINAVEDLLSVINTNEYLYEVEPNILSVFSRKVRNYAVPVDEFESYDTIAGNPYVNRIAWGNWPQEYRAFFLEALHANDTGIIVDYGARSLLYAAHLYTGFKDRTIVIMDDSVALLRHAKEKIQAVNGGEVPENLIFLHANMYDLPFKAQSIDTIISFGLLHNMSNTGLVSREFGAVLKETGDIYMTSLVTDRAVGRYFMNLLNRAGELIFPRTSDDLHNLLADNISSVGVVTKGNMAYISCHR